MGKDATEALRRIAEAVERERDDSTRHCPKCGAQTQVVATEEATTGSSSPPPVNVRAECDRKCVSPT
ncbi:hypothetical protein GCM10010359_19940 [Streptomyces morookaense]|nr:hypothetical protein GCM10010359_19940 [Streptomyces morookaense]